MNVSEVLAILSRKENWEGVRDDDFLFVSTLEYNTPECHYKLIVPIKFLDQIFADTNVIHSYTENIHTMIFE